MAEETNTQQVEIRDYAIDEYVPMEARYYGAKEMTSTWICANANPTTWYMGTILGALGLGGALLSAIIGNPLVYLILALVGIIGYKVASTNMGLCRVSFGIAGSKLPSFINALQFVGWCGVNTYIAATPLATLLCSIFGGDPHSPIMLIISVFIILLITTFVSVYGAKYIGKAQIVAVVCLAILSVWIGIRIFSLVSFSDIWKWSITDNPANSGWSLSFGGGLDIILANGFAWVMCAADYTRYTTSKKSATVAPMIGATLGFLWFVLIGATGAIAVAVTNGGLFDPYSADLSYICSSLGMGSIANLLIVISTIAVNMINIYSGGFSTANISEKLPPKGSMIGLGILSMLLALTPLVLGSFLDTFQVFLGYLGAVFPPCIAVLVVDYYLVRGQKYDITQFNNKNGPYWYKNGINWTGVISWVAGAAIYFAAKLLPGVCDSIGQVLFSFLATGIIYFIAAKATYKPETTEKEN